jgi:hypothetical protein
MRHWITCGLWFASLSGCALRGGVQVNEVAGGAAPPAHVTKVVTVTKHGKPVTTLRASAFRLEEDGQPLDAKTVDFRLLPPEDVVAFHTVLLMDMGPGATVDGRKLLAQSATRFVQKLRARQSVTVLAFDGSSHTRFIADFPQKANDVETVIAESRFASSTDPSRNLRGAVFDGLDRLESKLKQHVRPVRVGTLVVFSMGPDIASRTTAASLDERLAQNKNHLYFVGLKSDSRDAVVRELSRNGQALAPDVTHLSEAFDEMSELVSANMNGHYVLSYCTLARSGERHSRVEVDVVSDELEVETGSVESQFNAAGFSTGCNAAKPPRFSLFKAATK